MRASPVLRLLNNKKFLLCAILIFFLPFILFCFWNVPSADDYMILDKKELFSFWDLQGWVYQTWSGRYLSTFVSTAFSYSGFLYSHYYLHTILLLSLTLLAWMFLLRQLNTYLLQHSLSFSSVILVSLLLLVLEINIIPEPVTALYWFSSAITYQMPLILLIFLSGLMIRLLHMRGKKTVSVAYAAILVVLLNGCNESITLFVLLASTLLLAYYYSVYKKVPVSFLILYILNFISACFLLFAPGILYRSSLHEASPFLSIIAIAVIKLAVLHWYFLKEPLWWFSVLFVCSFVSNNRQLTISLQRNFAKHSPLFLLLVYVLSILFIYIPILYVANGSLPLRTENIICFLCSLILLVIVSVFISARVKQAAPLLVGAFQYRYLLVSILIFSSGNMQRVTDSLLSGYFYKQVMQERISLFEDAKRRQTHEVTFDAYEVAVSKRLKEHPLLERRVLKNIIVKTPPLICFESDLYDINYMKELYGIKILHLNKQ